MQNRHIDAGGGRQTGRVTSEPEHWFEPIADHLGAAYLRYSFTKGTEQEVDFLVDALALAARAARPRRRLRPGPPRPRPRPPRHRRARHRHQPPLRRPGPARRAARRHLRAPRRPPAAVRRRLRRRRLPVPGRLRHRHRRRARTPSCSPAWPGRCDPGGRLALSAFNAYFQVRFGEGTLDAATGVNHERTEVRDEHGQAKAVDLWTHCFTPTELRALVARGRTPPRRPVVGRARRVSRGAALGRHRRVPGPRHEGRNLIGEEPGRCYPFGAPAAVAAGASLVRTDRPCESRSPVVRFPDSHRRPLSRHLRRRRHVHPSPGHRRRPRHVASPMRSTAPSSMSKTARSCRARW